MQVIRQRLAGFSADTRSGSRQRGFSLVEMVLVIVLTGIVFAIGGTVLNEGFRSYFTARDITDADWQPRIAMERMAREIRAVRSATAVDLAITPATQIQFFDSDGGGVCFYRDIATNRLMRSADGPGAACPTTPPQPLADNVTTMTFSYWDNAGASTATVTAVYYVTVQIGISAGDYVGTFRTNVKPRNF
jgi:prepilin-type N-terminal cleavage/methylation domain-containing protein